MAQLLNEMEWGAPILPISPDPEWEAYIKSEGGIVSDLLQRVSPLNWLRQACLIWERLPVVHIPRRLADIRALVTAQENACRYCYGVARAQMRVMGYSEKMIGQVERDVRMAELNEVDRTFVRFCRNLSRSSPRPAKTDLEKLISLGFTPLAITEAAFVIAVHCFYNRLGSFISCAPELQLENAASSLLLVLIRPILSRKLLHKIIPVKAVEPLEGESFAGVVKALSGLQGARSFDEALRGAFASTVLSRELKLMMFAVVARAIGCPFCEEESCNLLLAQGVNRAEIEGALANLSSPRLDAAESRILAWTRETVHFQIGTIQTQTRTLLEEVGEEKLLEAIGVAALANTTVRLAMLLEQ